MPTSIHAFDVNDTEVGRDIQQASTLGELLSLVPSPYLPRMTEVVNKVYKCAVKANHVRSYLVSLEKHKQDSTFPSEIGGRIQTPVFQISKEYEATAEWKTSKESLEAATRVSQKAALDSAILLKKAELAYLQKVTREDSLATETSVILKEVTQDLLSDAGVALATDGTIVVAKIPKFLQRDYEHFTNNKDLYTSRALAIAFMVVQRESVSKMRALTLKKDADGDIRMDDVKKDQTVASLVQSEIQRLVKAGQIPSAQKPRESPFAKAYVALPDANSASEKIKWSGDQKYPTQTQSQGPNPSETESQGKPRQRKRKREWEEEISKEVKTLCRALPSKVGTQQGAGDGCPGSGAVATTRVSRRHRTLENTDAMTNLIEKHSELVCSVSTTALNQFVFHHTPVYLVEHGHEFASGVFMGPDVILPREIEYALALNAKFILHKEPNALLVEEAFEKLQRSVRLRWMFRNLNSQPSKFYVPKPDWQPPTASKWIEQGLQQGKDLLLSQATDLPLGKSRKPNPDLNRIQEFLRSSQSLVKLTDKNLGLAVVTKEWYLNQCRKMLSDESTYEVVPPEEIPKVIKWIDTSVQALIENGSVTGSTADYLSLSTIDWRLPTFHGIPKVHREQWSLRPIVPSHSWATRRCSELADFILRQCIKEVLPWCVESSKQVITLLEKETFVRSENLWLITGDVQSFYTNVPVDETAEGISKILGSKKYEGIDTSAVDTLLRVVMGCNLFEFDEKLYLQKTGVAMGTSCAPAFANLSLGLLELETIVAFSKEVRSELGLKFYARYIDDILLIFQGSRTALESFLIPFTDKLKPYTISWDIRSCREPTPFLDIELFFRQRPGPIGLNTRVFRKRMNKHLYIPWSSAHPLAVKRAFVKAEQTRFMILCSNKYSYEERVTEFFEALRRRGYPSDILRRWKHLVSYKDRAYVLAKTKETSRGLPLMLPSSYNEIWEYLDVRSAFEKMRDTWKKGGAIPPSLEGPLIKSLKRTENLFDKISAWNKATLAE